MGILECGRELFNRIGMHEVSGPIHEELQWSNIRTGYTHDIRRRRRAAVERRKTCRKLWRGRALEGVVGEYRGTHRGIGTAVFASRLISFMLKSEIVSKLLTDRVEPRPLVDDRNDDASFAGAVLAFDAIAAATVKIYRGRKPDNDVGESGPIWVPLVSGPGEDSIHKPLPGRHAEIRVIAWVSKLKYRQQLIT
ncbi:hypothetical protein CK231_29525 [Mesorhizobium loti]|uniref:Uncharacterized protein n=3 Tax=Mesorhizobium TaxID=68287 RepID=A0A1A5JZ15_RHILI|nr:hypothetical protein BAE41_21320 [Mesorhizobium loti]QGX78424.1 hypothetical protein EB234_17100 [Mesorhizobium japonicum R7A]RNJ43120.1 hypothetical protein DNR46_24515 [Mesorhizobium japonicum]RXT41286.1 hypothetical protein B5V01_23470 [Mesorhizobium erdmanii]OBP78447.1 hypothetical protein BAE42_28530 [Mesorhizobium loti]